LKKENDSPEEKTRRKQRRIKETDEENLCEVLGAMANMEMRITHAR
jgi:hypothetical protein